MIEYLVMRIQEGKLDYDMVITKFPQYKNEIDLLLNK